MAEFESRGFYVSTASPQASSHYRVGADLLLSAWRRAEVAFANTNCAECARLLDLAMKDVARIGGGGVQRKIVEDMLLLASMRSGESRRARDLLDRRLHRQPSQRDTFWRHQIEA